METKKVNITLEVVSPMLSHGKKYNAEFRVQELIASMRYWWRAVYFSKTNSQNRDMLQVEKEIFGSTEKKAPFSILLLNREQIKSEKFSNIIGCKNEISGISSGTRISLQILYKDSVNVELYINLIRLSSYLGGLGQRARRGYGCFRVVEDNKVKDFKSKIEYSIKNVQENTKKSKEIKVIKEDNNILRIDEKGYKHSYIRKIVIGEQIDEESYVKKIQEKLTETKEEEEIKGKIDEYLKLVYISRYAADENKVYPIIIFFNSIERNDKDRKRLKKVEDILLGGLQ